VLVQPTAGGPSYRQTRVYRYQEGQGWTHQAASAEYWGSARHFKSKYFVFHYYAIDEQAVRFAAARLDALYPELYRLLMGEAAIGEKKSVFVDPALPPQRQLFENEQGEITVTSPAAILLPTEMSEGDLLLQSLVLVLFKQFSDESFTRYRLVTHWARIHRALNLWFVWEHELPLAVWHGPLLQWIFATR
jgi:hypothetical protein